MNLNTYRRTGIAALSCLCLVGAAYASHAKLSLSRGTVIPITLNQNLSSDHSLKGDVFMGTVKSNYLGLPKGTRVEGVVQSVTAKSKNRPGSMDLDFRRLILPSGQAYALNGTPVGLDSKSVTTRNGRLVAKKGASSQRLTYVGYGAGAGLLVSVLGGGKNTVRNTAIGAGLGYLAGALDKSHKDQTNNVLLKSGAAIGVRLDSPLTVSY